MLAASLRATATPPFMSQAPRPYSRSSTSLDGRLPASGTVSRCPAITTRWDRPSCVRAVTVSPSRSTVRCGSGRNASSTASAIARSAPLTDGMSTSCASSRGPSRLRSSTQHTLSPAPYPPRRRLIMKDRPAYVARMILHDHGRAALYGGNVTHTAAQQGAWGWGLATITEDGRVLDTWYPSPVLGQPGDGDNEPPDHLARLVGKDKRRRVRLEVVRTVVGSLAETPCDVHDAYLRLHLISHRLIRPHGCNLDGIFGLLANVVWT